jgi:saccharopine dehydrogenase-like NADP-dependent oxidoreductase
MKRVLLIGCTGTFGQRLATHLSKMPELNLVLTSRSKERAQDVEKRLISEGATAALSCLALHIARDLLATLVEIKPWLVIDSTGPFQFAKHDVPRAALEANAHYLDLADAQDYLVGFGGLLDDLAKPKGLVALAGASTTPALTTAVVDHVTRDWQRIDTVDVAIVPGGSNTVGPALAAAVLAQAGVPVTTFRHGRFSQVFGWLKGSPHTVPRLGRFRAVAAETIDPLIMAERYKLTSRMTFSAGLVSSTEQYGFEVLAWLRRIGLLTRYNWLVPVLVAGRKFTRHFCDDRGGMVIRVTGLDAETRWTEVTWSLLAEKGHGPHVPILPLVAAVRMLLADEIAPGARLIQGEIPLDKIEQEFESLAITAQLQHAPRPSGIFEDVLGSQNYATLPRAVRLFHNREGHPVWQGEADVDRGTNIVSRIVGAIIGLPKAGRGLRCHVSVERRSDGAEKWTRTFDALSFCSLMSKGKDRKLLEAFGPAIFTLGLEGSDRGTDLPVLKGRVFGIPLPQFLLPRSTAHEFSDDQGRFRFDVKLDLPVFGLLVHYRGWLVPRSSQEYMS